MGKTVMSCGISVQGKVVNCPAHIAVEYQNGKIAFCGVVLLKNAGLKDMLSVLNQQLSDQFGGYASGILPHSPAAVKLYHVDGNTAFLVDTKELFFHAAVKEKSAAVLFSFKIDGQSEENADRKTLGLLNIVKQAADFLGLKEFFLFGRIGTQLGLPQLLDKAVQPEKRPQIPARLSAQSFIVFSHLLFDGSSAFHKAMRDLFGLKETWLFIAAGKNTFTAMAQIPNIKNSLLECSNMFLELGVEQGKTVMAIAGGLRLQFLKEILFTVSCRIGIASFLLEASAEVEKPLKLIGPLAVGDTCLSIGFQNGLSFGMYSTLYIGNIELFGAVLLAQTPVAMNVELVCAAFGDLTLPGIIKNVTGLDINGIECLNFIKILGLPFQQMPPIDSKAVETGDEQAVVSWFNGQITQKSLALIPGEVKISRYNGSLNVVDEHRMRHYSIAPNGCLSLKAQFYYACVKKKFGAYNIEPGIFLCGVIEIFKLHFEVLFSFRESEGVLAYARLRSVDLGFLKISESKKSLSGKNTLPLPADSVFYQFMGGQQDGVVFFLSASGRDVSFYLDGRIEFLSLFSFEASIIFCKGLISIDVGFEIWGILEVTLHLKLDYSSFTKGGFEFCLIVSTAKLTEKLQSVQQKINQAIGRYREKINNAKREIDRAQAHVDQLYSQIGALNRKIEDCKAAIRNAKWWKKAFVAIARGIEIGAYEVAKAGVYAAIGVATAALAVAKKVVDISGKVGEGVLKAVNGVIQGIMSIFYLNRIELKAFANKNTQQFSADIQFVALGKSYHISAQFGAKSLQHDAQGVLSDSINNKMDYDLNHLEDGTFRSNRKRFQHMDDTVPENTRRMKQAVLQLSGGTALMRDMQNYYREEFGENMPEFDEMNTCYINALDTVSGILEAGHLEEEMKTLSRSMGGLRRSVRAREKQGVYRNEDLSDLSEILKAYDEAKVLYAQISKNINVVEAERTSMKKVSEKTGEFSKVDSSGVFTGANGQNGSMARVLNRTEESMMRNFPVDRAENDFINLSKEDYIRRSFEEARKEFGAAPSKKVEKMRQHNSNQIYDSRL